MATTIAEFIPEEAKRDQIGRKITPAARRAELVAAYRSSGLTMKQFARQEGIKALTLAKWSTLAGRRPAVDGVQFAELKVGLPLSASWAFEVTLPNGLLVRSASAAALAELLSLIRK